MKVILLQDIKGTGKKGDIINAKDGYCQNFLFPKKLAAPANKENMGILEKEQKLMAEIKRVELEKAQALSEKVNGKDFIISVKCGENGKLFGSVTNKEISAVIEDTAGISIDRKKIVVDDPLKTTGKHEVSIKLHPDVNTKINVVLKAIE